MLMVQMSHQVSTEAEDLKVIPTESSIEPMRVDRLSRERERRRKVKDDLSKHSHSGWANKLNSDLSFTLLETIVKCILKTDGIKNGWHFRRQRINMGFPP